jgi:hypothetical protein
MHILNADPRVLMSGTIRRMTKTKSAEEVVVAEGERLDLRQRDRTLAKLHDKISV